MEDPLSCPGEVPVEDIKVEDFDASCVDEDTAAENESNDQDNQLEDSLVQDNNVSNDEGNESKHVENVTSEEEIKCCICPSLFKTVRSMRQHLAWIHFGEAILLESGSTPNNCGKCSYELTGKRKRPGKDIVLHLTSKHGYLYQVIPVDLKSRLLKLDSVGKGWMEMHIGNGTAPEGSLSCPYCKMPIKTYDGIVEHVVLQHHLHDILISAGCIDTDSCSICGKVFASSRKTVPQKLASHLALVHGYLNTVLMAEARSELARLKESLRNKCLNLRKNRKVKSLCIEKKPTVKKVKKQQRSRRAKDKNKRVGPIPVPDNIKECLAAFKDAQEKGKFGDDLNSANLLNNDGTSKSFLTSMQMYEWQCYLCFQKARGVHQLRTHLASKHFREQVLFFWQNDSSFEKPCQYCKKEVINDISLPLGSKQFKALYHLIHVHDILYHIVNENIKKGLEEFDKPVIVCPICQAGQISKAELELHLLVDHYREEIYSASNSTAAQCGICKAKTHWRKTTLRHIGKQHRDFLSEVIDPEVMEYLDHLEDTAQGVFIKEEGDGKVEVDDAQMNFVDVSSILVKSEETLTAQVKVEPSETFPDASSVEATSGPVCDELETDNLEVDGSNKAKKRKMADNTLDEDLSDIVVTNPTLYN